jgi:hypothetical protein
MWRFAAPDRTPAGRNRPRTGLRRSPGIPRAGRSHRDPEIGERERGGVVDAVADHDHRTQVWIGAHRAHDLELVFGGLLGVDAVDSELAAHALGDRAAVSGEHRDVPHALCAAAPRCPRRRAAARRPSRSRRRRHRQQRPGRALRLTHGSCSGSWRRSPCAARRRRAGTPGFRRGREDRRVCRRSLGRAARGPSVGSMSCRPASRRSRALRRGRGRTRGRPTPRAAVPVRRSLVPPGGQARRANPYPVTPARGGKRG